MKNIETHLRQAVSEGASDVLIISGTPISYKRGSELVWADEVVMPDTANQTVSELYRMAGRPMDKLNATGDDDFPLSVPGLSRFRVSAYRQRGSLAAVVRVVAFSIPAPQDIGLTPEVMSIAELSHGLALVTGPSGAGKSTTLACIVDAVNSTRSAHIITLEDPVEYLHKNKKSAVSQREIGSDTQNYVSAMRACLRQTPDVILLGEMRDYETICAAVTAAETGHLVLSTLHTVGAVNTIDRIIDVFPPSQQGQIRIQLSQILRVVVSQQLLPTIEGGVTPVFEVMRINSAIRTLIREAKTHQINSVIQSSGAEGMLSMDASILAARSEGKITAATAVKYALNPGVLAKKLEDGESSGVSKP